MKNVQISEELFFSLIKYHLLDMEELQSQIQKALEQKVDNMVRHQIYTTYKTAPTEEEREKARVEYLEKVGMQRDFRW
ncbi:MAG: complexin-2 [Clostridiales bacterium]|nr:complexin-2 [Clostridiales bacterium]